MHFPLGYPYSRPRITFQTPILHPNISREGAISLNILSVDWVPMLTIEQVLVSIRDFLGLPNPNDPFNLEIAQISLQNSPDYLKRVQEYTLQYAK